MTIIKCDTCGKRKTDIKLQVGDTTYDFCSYICLWKFVVKEHSKNNPRTNIEFGKEK